MKPKTVTNIIDDSESNKVLIVTNANHTISDTESYSLYVFTGLTASRYLYFPTCTSHPGKEFTVINDTGTYNVICTPSGTDAINSYNAAVDITELHGWWKFKSQTTKWRGITDGNSTVYYDELVTDFTVSNATTATWYNITGLSLSLPVGIYLVSGHTSYIYIADTDEVLTALFGISTVSGNFLPDIDVGACIGVWHGAVFAGAGGEGSLPDKKYTATEAKTLYGKMYGSTGAGTITLLSCIATDYKPAWIKARRIA